MNSYSWQQVPSKLNVIRFTHGNIFAEITSVSASKFLYTVYFDWDLLYQGVCSRKHDAKRSVKRKLNIMAEEFRLASIFS